VDDGNTIVMTMKIEGKPEATALRDVQFSCRGFGNRLKGDI
jgi:hypothetical protein